MADAKRRPRIRAIDLRVWRPNEFTVWGRPRREVGIGWNAYVWGCVRIVVHLSTTRDAAHLSAARAAAANGPIGPETAN